MRVEQATENADLGERKLADTGGLLGLAPDPDPDLNPY
jgi:hypothetical protein